MNSKWVKPLSFVGLPVVVICFIVLSVNEVHKFVISYHGIFSLLVSFGSVLAIVYYSIKVSESVDKQKENVHVQNKTLKEMKRDRKGDHIVELLSEGINPILSNLEKFRKFSRPKGTKRHFKSEREYLPNLSWDQPFPDIDYYGKSSFATNGERSRPPMPKDIILDLEHEYPELIRDIREFSQVVSDYERIWNDVKDNIEDYFEDNWDRVFGSKEEIEKEMDINIDKYDRDINKFLEFYGDQIPWIVLKFSKRWTVDPTTEYEENEKEFFNNHIDDLLAIRDVPEISRKIKALKHLLYMIKNDKNYYDQLKELKEDYMEEYDIYPSEIEDNE